MMISHLALRTMRARLAAAIALVTIAALGGSFFALHQRTGSDLQGRIDSNLREQYAEFQQELPGGISSGRQLERSARSFIASQRYHPESRIFLIEVAGGRNVTNERRVIEPEVKREGAEQSNLLDAPDGLANVSTEEASRLRVYSQPILAGGRRLGTFRVADPRAPIERAQSALRNTFLVVGAVALLVSLIVAGWLATLITRPIRRVASVASDVDAGDLTHRIGDVRSSDEVRLLAESFDHMLDRLEGAFQRQREFVSDASHELRTPLTVLRGQTELLGRIGNDPEERRRVVGMLLRELDQMNRLIEDMLALARAEAGELVRPQTILLGEFLEDLERDLPLLGARDFRVERIPDGTLEADPERLTQVFRNLAQNAVDHTGTGERITVSGTVRGGSIEFCVADTGPGIPPDRLERIFDRFHRVDEARDRDHGGSGLGLAIARAIVEAHGGRIWAESPLGEGAQIHFELPGFRRSRRAERSHAHPRERA
jgi:two-component system OmpR family sensor kinase